MAMADPMTIAIATAMAGKAVEVAGEPVRAAVAELAQRVRDRFRGRPADEQALERARGDQGHKELQFLQLAVQRLLEEDPELRIGLEAMWNQAHTSAAASGDGVVNLLNGTADRVVQLRDVHGDLTIT